MAVYFITRNGDPDELIKIGTTQSLERRLSSLRTVFPEGLKLLVAVDGGYELERHFHAIFHKERVTGEWFEPSHSLLEVISALMAVGSRNLEQSTTDKGILDTHAAKNSADALLAQKLLERCVPVRAVGSSVKEKILVVAGVLGWSHSRTRDLWYRDERATVRAWEMRELQDAARDGYRASIENEQIQNLASDVEQLREEVAALRAFFGALDRSGTEGRDR